MRIRIPIYLYTGKDDDLINFFDEFQSSTQRNRYIKDAIRSSIREDSFRVDMLKKLDDIKRKLEKIESNGSKKYSHTKDDKIVSSSNNNIVSDLDNIKKDLLNIGVSND